MKIRIVEVEADKEELKASSTLGEQASTLLKNLFMGLNGNSYEEDEEAEDTEDE